MRALILAGGRGKRLGSLTDSIPKPLVSLGGTTPLDFVLSQIIEAGASETYVSVGYLATTVENHIYHAGYRQLGVQCIRDPEGLPLGTAGPIGLIPGREGTVVVFNTDIFCPALELSEMVAWHEKHEAAITIGYRIESNRVPYGVIELSDSGQVRGVQEKPLHTFPVAGGIYVLDLARIDDLLPADPAPLTMPELVRACLDSDRPCIGYELAEPWIDLGTPERLAEATTYMLATRRGAGT